MAIFEWRRFNFFELRNNADKERITDAMNGSLISAATNGNGQVVICDNEGSVHVFTKGWNHGFSFKAHDSSILFCGIALQTNYLVTIGNEENSTGCLLKIWNLTKASSKPTYCLRSAKVTMPRPTAMSVSENGQLLAIGFERGNIALYRGDVSRDRAKTLKTLTAGTSSIVGIAFRQYEKATQMFVCSNSGVYVFNILSKDREVRVALDTETSQMRCCELQTKHFNEGQFFCGRDDAIYCYTSDGRGPCYVLEGEKQFIKWFRNHLIIISTYSNNMPVAATKSTITVIDLTNKFIVFSTQVNEIVAVFVEFGTCFLVSNAGTVYLLSEKDLQSKLNLLYKKNLFDIAVRIAKSQHHDSEGLSEIFRQYGDHLYAKSNFSSSVEQYIKTIGHLEPSYVIRRFLDSRHIQFLSTYLQALHEKRQATADHTTLLVNCFTRLNKTVKLEEFFDLYNGKDITFDVEVATSVCRDTMAYDQALMLTEKSKKHNIHIDILLNDLHSPSEACSYIEMLKPEDAKEALLKYGSILIEKKPSETVEILKSVCKDSKSRPEEFLFIFVDSTECLLDFLEDVTKNVPNCSQLIYDTLVELYLKHQNRHNTEAKLMQILMERKLYDQKRAMFLCRHYTFWPGLNFLFGEERLSHLIVRYCVQNEDYDELLNCCQPLGSAQPSLWLQALMGIRSNARIPMDLTQKILYVITNEKLLSPLQVLNCLAVQNGPNLGAVRDFFIRAFKKEMESRKRDEEVIRKYKEGSEEIKQQIAKIKNEPMDFKDPACSSCKQALTLPSVHFYCQHSFHLECIQSFSETDMECPVCADLNQQIMEVLRAQGSQTANHEQFHTQLERSPETFSVISEYLGRGLFNQILLVDDNLSQTEPPSVPITVVNKVHESPKEVKKYESKQDNIAMFMSQTLKVSPKPNPRISPSASAQQQTIFEAVTKNPFEEDEGGDQISKNPFEEYDESKNPFGDDDSYDNNLNPFA